MSCLRSSEHLEPSSVARRPHEISRRAGALPSASLYAHTFGSLGNALREAGFEVLQGEERLERAVEQGAALAHDLGRLPKMADWADARRADPRSCPSGRCIGCSTSRVVRGPRFSTSSASAFAWTAWTSYRTGRYAALTEASAASRSRHETASRGARTGGRYVFAVAPIGPEPSLVQDATRDMQEPSLADLADVETSRSAAATIVSARQVEAK